VTDRTPENPDGGDIIGPSRIPQPTSEQVLGDYSWRTKSVKPVRLSLAFHANWSNSGSQSTLQQF